jgi:hypothetical protein
MLFKWRREPLRAASPRATSAVLLPVEVAPASSPDTLHQTPMPLLPTALTKQPPRRGGVIELEVASV